MSQSRSVGLWASNISNCSKSHFHKSLASALEAGPHNKTIKSLYMSKTLEPDFFESSLCSLEGPLISYFTPLGLHVSSVK